MTLALTVFQGRAGDHNARGFGGAAAVGAEWQRRLGLTAATIGAPQPPLSTDWQAELTAATPTLEAMAHRYDTVYTAGQTPVTLILKGVSSPLARPGRYSTKEALVHQTHNWILDRVLDPA